MLVYKFRSFSNHEWIEQIVQEGQLYCAQYETLNDPFEGIFHLILEGGGGVARSVAGPIARGIARSVAGGGGSYTYKKAKSLKEVFAQDTNRLVCSLSAEAVDPRLWSHYAANCEGIAIGIDFTNYLDDLMQVTYHSSLQQFNSRKIAAMTAKEVLSFKTKHWEYEKEFRVIQSTPCYNAKERVRSVLLGPRIKDDDKRFILGICPPAVQIFETELDFKNVQIRTKSEVLRT